MDRQYRIAGSSLIKVEIDSDINVEDIRNVSTDIDWAWIVTEDGTLVHKDKTYEVKAGNIILKLYSTDELVIVNSPEWYNVITERIRNYKEAMKKRMAECNGECDTRCDCKPIG